MTVLEGVYKQSGLADQLIPLAVDADGKLATTATATMSGEIEIKNDSGNAVPVSAVGRTSVGRQTLSVTTAAISTLEVPPGAVSAVIQADGNTISLTLEGTNPTSSVGLRVDDGVMFYVDTPLASVKLVARTTTTNVQVCYFDKV